MPSQNTRPLLIAIVGPTCVGKTEISIQLAERLEGEIVSADSRLFYRGMDIGTAKPTQAELSRVPHHLIDVADPDQSWSLAVFQSAAQENVTQVNARGKLPFLVGGTGQYIWAVLESWTIPPHETDSRLRQVLQKWADQIGHDELHRKLTLLDPVAAETIDPRNVRRTIRALEVIFGTGRRFSDQKNKKTSPYRTLILGIRRSRTDLYARIDQRIDAMLADGLIDEVKNLLKKGYADDLPTLSAIGYREVIDYLKGRTTYGEAVMLIRRNTRVFVRRQANWFREDNPQIHWFDAEPGVVDQMEILIRQFKNE
jgi:tRNA dimethylallyltransferase